MSCLFVSYIWNQIIYGIQHKPVMLFQLHLSNKPNNLNERFNSMTLMPWILMLLIPYRLLVVIIFSGRCARRFVPYDKGQGCKARRDNFKKMKWKCKRPISNLFQRRSVCSVQDYKSSAHDVLWHINQTTWRCITPATQLLRSRCGAQSQTSPRDAWRRPPLMRQSSSENSRGDKHDVEHLLKVIH